MTGVFLGALFAQGRQTVSRRLRAAGASGDCQRYYCFLSRLGRKTNSAAGRLLARAVERTAPAGRILLDYAFETASIEEIAAGFAVTPSAARQRLRRALAALAVELRRRGWRPEQ